MLLLLLLLVGLEAEVLTPRMCLAMLDPHLLLLHSLLCPGMGAQGRTWQLLGEVLLGQRHPIHSCPRPQRLMTSQLSKLHPIALAVVVCQDLGEGGLLHSLCSPNSISNRSSNSTSHSHSSRWFCGVKP